ncbi:MAG: hypothetical protein GY756_26955 [bacterium]|nr:hypothetical protein [bacterium]
MIRQATPVNLSYKKMELIERIRLKDIIHNDDKTHIHKWKYIEVSPHNRLYWKLKNKGFLFYDAELNGYECNDITDVDIWNENYCDIECIIYGNAGFDGVRHLYFGSEQTDNTRYFDYPDLNKIVNVFKSLESLEKQYCAGSKNNAN